MAPPLLVRLGLSQPQLWDPPYVLDRLLASPVRAVAYYLWQWIAAIRGWAAERLEKKKTTKSTVRVVCISDTHDMIVPDVPDGDLLIHAGDLTNAGTAPDLQRQLDWLASLPHEHKVVVCGNHDTWFDPRARQAAGLPASPAPSFGANVHYLEHDSTTLQFANGRALKIYGAPDIPKCGPDHFAFQYERSSPTWKDTIPDDIDILVTHPPPRHHLDLGLGCFGLLEEVWRVRPALHVFGHVHWGAGREVLHWGRSQRAYEELMDVATVGDADWEKAKEEEGAAFGLASLSSLPGRLGRLGRLLAAAAVSTLLLPLFLAAPQGYFAATGGNSTSKAKKSTILVNAGQMRGNTGRLGHNHQVVDL